MALRSSGSEQRCPPASHAGTGGAAGQDSSDTILVVDDESAMLEVAARILRRQGYAVWEATTSAEALALAAAHDFDLLLTDAVMPHMSGPELAGHIDNCRPGRPVLYMSGYGGLLGPDPVPAAQLLAKPFTAEELLGRVRASLAARRPEAQTADHGLRAAG